MVVGDLNSYFNAGFPITACGNGGEEGGMDFPPVTFCCTQTGEAIFTTAVSFALEQPKTEKNPSKTNISYF